MSIQVRASLAILAIALSLSACSRLAKRRAVETNVHELTVNGTTRLYLLRVPAEHSSAHPLPLVLVLHGGGGNGKNAEEMTGFTKAAEGRAIVAYPYGTGKRFKESLLTWNAGNCCGHALDAAVDDVAFLRQLIQTLKAQYPVDEHHIYVTGMSNGGMMAYRAACELSDLITGVGVVAGAMNVEACRPVRPLSVIVFHGRQDQHVRYSGGAPEVTVDSHPRIDRSVAYAEAFWKDRNGCGNRTVEKNGPVEKVAYICARAPLLVNSIDGEGHTWPGGEKGTVFADPPTQEISASRAMLQFWMAH